MLVNELAQRELGILHPRTLVLREAYLGCTTLNMHPTWPRLTRPLSSHITCLALEDVEHRYLLVGTRGGHVHVLDAEVTSGQPPPMGPGRHAKVLSAPRHQAAISAVQWYAHDTGMFYSASFDRTINVVDANVGEVCALLIPLLFCGPVARFLPRQQKEEALLLLCSRVALPV
eukprot:TRINITY_DN4811_c0_g1_i2.p1 TRINITY_DN4811_c0_g1~~TRINITY_DN4811_c0_g1_i2.p1  ORF type:complete len:173 (-),score=27.26 TRINITY_DN4811_c0_g1_i2:206-724(-)